MVLVDTHCHLDCECFDADRGAVLERARAAGVVAQLVPAVRAAEWPRIAALCAAQPDLWPAYGLHPVYVAEHADADLEALERWLGEHRAVAVGEIGLDYYVEGLDYGRQRALFEAQLDIARAAGLPVVIHARKCHDDVLKALRPRHLRGVIHAFNGSEQQARAFIDLGFVLGFGGAMTYARALKLRRLARTLPLESIVLETDAPDIAPEGHRNERNEPAHLRLVAEAMAALRVMPVATLARATTDTAYRLFAAG